MDNYLENEEEEIKHKINYEVLNQNLENPIKNSIQKFEANKQWENNDDNKYDCNVGSIIYTLALRSYDLVSFVRNRLSYKVTKDESNEESTLTPYLVIGAAIAVAAGVYAFKTFAKLKDSWTTPSSTAPSPM